MSPAISGAPLRHTFASHYVMRGSSIVKLQAILGWQRPHDADLRSAGSRPSDRCDGDPRGLGASGNSASVAHGVLSEQASLAARG